MNERASQYSVLGQNENTDPTKNYIQIVILITKVVWLAIPPVIEFLVLRDINEHEFWKASPFH